MKPFMTWDALTTWCWEHASDTCVVLLSTYCDNPYYDYNQAVQFDGSFTFISGKKI